jgi:hypothetical protein
LNATGHDTSDGAREENQRILLGKFGTACEAERFGVKREKMNAKRGKFFSAASLAGLLAGMLVCGVGAFVQENKPDTGAASEKPKTQDKKDSKTDEGTTTKLKIVVTGNDKPVGNASVYVRFNMAGGMLHKEKQAEVDLKTNENGTAKVRDLPRGKILIQVVAKGWHTFGKWYELDSDDQTIEIKLEPPPHWY